MQSFEPTQSDKWKSATVAAALAVSGRRKMGEELSAVSHKGQDDD